VKKDRLTWTFLLLLAVALQLPAQQGGADRKLLADIRAKAEKGDAQSQYELGSAFFNGSLGVVKDEAEAVKWYRKAAEQNFAAAQYNLGVCYANGQGVAKDETEAAKWYCKAAEQNYALAQFNLGICYACGQGMAKADVEAVKWFRKAAEQNLARAQWRLGAGYEYGQGVAKDETEAVKWHRKAAEQNFEVAQCVLGDCYATGQGVAKDQAEAVKWYRKAAEKNVLPAQYSLGFRYFNGLGAAKNQVEAVEWWRKAAQQNYAAAQRSLGAAYCSGSGVPKDYVEAYKWVLLAAGQGDETAKKTMTTLENMMTPEQVAEGQKLARNFKAREVPPSGGESSAAGIALTRPESSGTGFFIAEDGYCITNEHVAGNGAEVRLVTSAGLIPAKVVKVDGANDLALLKAEGKFAALPVAVSRAVMLGATVATVGFPNIGLQGFAPKLAKGEIASLSGAQDDARYFQISVPVQPGNSGGALVDERGNVVGVVSAKLDAAVALNTSGALPENVNYAVKSSFLLGFLESVPEVSAKLKEPNTKERKFEDMVKSTEQAAVLVLVY
jgi:TPR repeat protein